MDSTVLNRFDRVGDLDQLAGGFFGVGIGAVDDWASNSA
jgi:hypothetical protein